MSGKKEHPKIVEYFNSGKQMHIRERHIHLPLRDIDINHFSRCPYLWEKTPQTEGPNKGLYRGIWVNDTLPYIWSVMVSPEILKYVIERIYFNEIPDHVKEQLKL